MLSDIFNAIATISHWCKLNNQVENAEGGAYLLLVFLQCIVSNAVHWFTDHHHHRHRHTHTYWCSAFVLFTFLFLSDFFYRWCHSTYYISLCGLSPRLYECCLRHTAITRQATERMSQRTCEQNEIEEMWRTDAERECVGKRSMWQAERGVIA